MSNKKNEINVDELLGQYENNNRTVKETAQTKQKKNDQWEEEEDQAYVFSIAKDTTSSNKPKTTKKKNTVKGWGEFEAEQTVQKPEPEKEEVPEVQDLPKKKTWKKPTGETNAAQEVKVLEGEYFPSLGEDVSHLPKKEVEYQPRPQESTSSGPRRFMNANKKATGEAFVPIENVAEKEVPVKTSQPIFQRGTEVPQQKVETPLTAEEKFKFGGEGPKRFVSSKHTKKEEEKSEQEILREAREREIEEKLQKEKEEMSKEIEARKARKAFLDKKQEETKDKTDSHKPSENTEKIERAAPTIEKKEEQPENGEPKRVAKFTNAKKVQAPQEKTDAELKEIASTQAWGEGGFIKKSKKKD